MNFDSITEALVTIAKILLSPASFKSPGLNLEGPAVLVLPGIIAILLLSIWSFIWLFYDARKRSNNGLVAIVFVIITGWPLSLLWWFWLRPPLIKQK
jgi:hypothetical protein